MLARAQGVFFLALPVGPSAAVFQRRVTGGYAVGLSHLTVGGEKLESVIVYVVKGLSLQTSEPDGQIVISTSEQEPSASCWPGGSTLMARELSVAHVVGSACRNDECLSRELPRVLPHPRARRAGRFSVAASAAAHRDHLVVWPCLSDFLNGDRLRAFGEARGVFARVRLFLLRFFGGRKGGVHVLERCVLHSSHSLPPRTKSSRPAPSTDPECVLRLVLHA